MAVMVIVEWDGVTKEQYERARELVNWEGDAAPGALFHASAFDEKGLRVFDLWDTPASFQTFVEGRLMPGAQQIGIQGQPRVQVLELHRSFAPGFTSTAVA